MHVLNLSLDPKALDHESVVSVRNRAYGKLVGRYSIVVPSPAHITVRLSDHTVAHGVGGGSKLIQLLNIYRVTSRIIREERCDVITTQDPYFLGLLGYLFARRYHLGFEIQILGIEKLSPLRKMLAQFVLHRGGKIRALSNRLRDRLIREFGVDEADVTVVPIYVDVGKLGLDIRLLDAADAKKFTLLSESFKSQYGHTHNFLTVSRLVSIKNIPLQFRALKRILDLHPDTRLHIVGDGPEAASLKQSAENLGLSNHVIFHGSKYGYELGMFYLNADCFLLTSQYEGWGMVIVEAAIAGLPVIMTDVGCAGELIVDGESGLVIPDNDEEALFNALRRIIEERGLKEKLALGASASLKTLPDFEEILSMYRGHWEHALAHRL